MKSSHDLGELEDEFLRDLHQCIDVHEKFVRKAHNVHGNMLAMDHVVARISFEFPENEISPIWLDIHDKLAEILRLMDLAEQKDLKIEETEQAILKKLYGTKHWEWKVMRQTLLGWQMAKRGEYGAEDWVHVDVIPNENKQLRDKITSPSLRGNDISEAWRSVLRQPHKYHCVDPQELLKPIIACDDTESMISYLRNRYWA